uniref:Uncharacterized protein n=1 Tax=Arundo donax TaxID=35708 RepID=A0A0A9H0B8_ARUDO
MINSEGGCAAYLACSTLRTSRSAAASWTGCSAPPPPASPSSPPSSSRPE